MQVGSVGSMGAVAPRLVVPPTLLRVGAMDKLEALTRMAITPSVQADQLAVALGMTVKEVAGLVEAYQAALRALLSTAGFWLPSVNSEIAKTMPLVDPRTPTAGATVLVTDVSKAVGVGLDNGATIAGAPSSVPRVEHEAYMRALGLAPLAVGEAEAAAVRGMVASVTQAGGLGAPDAGSALPRLVAMMAIQVGAGPTAAVFLLDAAIVGDPADSTSIHVAAQQAMVAAGNGRLSGMVVAHLGPGVTASGSGQTVPAAVVATPPVSMDAGTAARGAAAHGTATTTATSAATVAATGVHPAATRSLAAANDPGSAAAVAVTGGVLANQVVSGRADILMALEAARSDPRAGYRAWPTGPALPQAIPAADVASVARAAAPVQIPVPLGGGVEASGNVGRLLIASQGEAVNPPAITVVADGRAVVAAIEAARAQPEQVAALVLDLTVALRAAVQSAAPEAAHLARAAMVQDPARLAELLAASTLGSAPVQRRRRRKRASSGDDDARNLAKDFFAALFSIRVAEDLDGLDVPITLLAPDEPGLRPLLERLDRDLAHLSVRFSDVPSAEVLEVLRLD